MIWADRVALLAEIPVVWLAVMIGAVFVPMNPAANPGIFQPWLGLNLAIVLPLWLALRIIDLIFDGPARRRIIAPGQQNSAARLGRYEVLPPCPPVRD